MPRARKIKPGFFENEFIGEQPGDIQILFIGLWTQADREGVIELRIPKLRKALFGFRKDITDDIINNYLTVLERLDNGSMLERIECNGIKYIVIKNFDYHQKPHHTESKGKLPSLKTLMEAKNKDLTVKQRLSNGDVTVPITLTTELLTTELLTTDPLTTNSNIKDLYPEPREEKINGTVFKKDLGNIEKKLDVRHHIKDETLEKVKKRYGEQLGWDVQEFLIKKYNERLQQTGAPNNWDAGFLGWCKNFTKEKPPN